MERDKQVNVHIEKTAGTTLNRFYEDLFGSENVLYFNITNNTFYRASEHKGRRTSILVDLIKKTLGNTSIYPLILKLNKATKGQLPTGFQKSELSIQSFDVVSGHFNADYFDEILTNPKFTVVLRHPLDRAISQYFHWQRSGGNVMFIDKIKADKGMHFRDFALLPELQNFQSNRLSNKDLRDFDAVGVTESLDTFCYKVHTLSGSKHPLPDIKHLNVNPRLFNKDELCIDQYFLKKFESENSQDYTNYEIAKNLATTYT